jgi:ribosomal protein S18 acetylase RimI-like enzyme
LWIAELIPVQEWHKATAHDWSDARGPKPLIAIDRRHQGPGLGRAALALAIRLMKSERPERTALGLSYLPENVVAEQLYASMGFVKNHMLNGKGSIEAWLRL